jgi:uncharacterized protein with PQ loop repeat
MSTVLHHHSLIKRINEKQEEYPHPTKHKRVLDKLIYLVGIVQPLTTLPQVYKIWIERQASGISLFTYTCYALFDMIWIYYGIVHKEKPIVIMYCLWVLLNSSIAIGAVLYG